MDIVGTVKGYLNVIKEVLFELVSYPFILVGKLPWYVKYLLVFFLIVLSIFILRYLIKNREEWREVIP